MKVKYSLVENVLTGNEKKYMARIRSTEQWDMDKIVDRMANSGSSVTRTDAIAVLHLFFNVICDGLIQGATIHTPLFKIELKIRGNFKGPEDRFWPKRHRVEAAITNGKELKENVKRVKLVKAESRRKMPAINHFRYLDQELSNDVLRPGGIIVLSGLYLKLDKSDPEQRLVLRKGGAEIPIDQIHISKGKELIAQLPADIPIGSYQLEVYTKPGSCKIARKAVWGKVLVRREE